MMELKNEVFVKKIKSVIIFLFILTFTFLDLSEGQTDLYARYLQGQRIYLEIITGKKNLQILTETERNDLIFYLSVRRSEENDENKKCTDAKEEWISASEEVLSKMYRLKSCIENLSYDCDYELLKLKRSLSDLEDAESQVDYDCN